MNNRKHLIQLGPSLTRLHQIKMRTLLLLLLFCHVSSPVLHSMKHFTTASTGIPNLSEVMATVEVDELLVVSCDSNKRVEIKQDWAKKFLIERPELLEWYGQQCLHLSPIFKAFIYILMSLYNQSGGVHVLQRLNGCEWDDETGEVKGFVQFAYDGEDFLKLDLNTLTWIALRPEAVTAKLIWDADKELGKVFKIFLTQIFPEQLRQYVKYGGSILLRTELP
ncbi:class I histocompatibility antigen, F10 alpha chain-like, partial [Sparus aurata]|uniref:class I histocompatibility antigen, F10 alpha chain-like n=1 Tax=Sparus aurata TaxID=8175 RepID=UPI0011C127E0